MSSRTFAWRDLDSLSDAERRAELRTFLMDRRSRLQPEQCGLPRRARRRVRGLRREEVAELAGVSTDWYRWFESGRTVRTSPQFIARLGRVFGLDPFEQRTLYRLAVPEVYATERAVRNTLGVRFLSPIQLLSDIEPVAREIAVAREQFLSGRAPPRNVRARIANSWERSRALGIDPLQPSIPAAAKSADELASLRNASEALLTAAAPIQRHLATALPADSFVVAIANAEGSVLELSNGRDLWGSLSRIRAEPGCDLSERASGTNAIGTVIEDGRPIQLMGAETFCVGGLEFCSTAAPIRHPLNHELLGVLDVTADYHRIHPELLSLVSESALEIEECLAALPLTV